MEVNVLYLVVLGAVLGYLYRLLTRNYGYFHEKPIPSMATRLLFGSTAPLMLRQCSFPDFIKRVYDKYANVKVFGLFDTTTPMFVLRDPELIKQIGVKDFDHFVDHRPQFGHTGDVDDSRGLFRQSLFAIDGQRWRDMRATLSPAFTGSKMRQMFGLVVECTENTAQYQEEQVKQTGSAELDLKDTMSRLAADVIGSCAFGMKFDCYKDRDNEFLRQGRMIVQFARSSVLIRIFTMRLFPKLASKLGLDFIDREQADYFSNLIRDTVKMRQTQGITRHDMIDLLLQARKGVLRYQQEKETQEGFATAQESEVGKVQVSKTITETEMIAQCLLFFLGGFETVSTCAVFTIYELVRNPTVQETLYREILDARNSLGGKPVTYDVLQKMKYMDMVLSESLRMWPPAPVLDRLCVHDYTLDAGDGLKFTIDKGSCVWIPAYGLHHDPKYFPEPERFDPERFDDANRANINTGAYLPFGIGPRNCIGSRFALMEVKAILYFMLLKFSFHPSAKTEIPITLKKGFANVGTEDGTLFVEFRLRKGA